MVGDGSKQPGGGSKIGKGLHPQNFSNNSAIHLCKIVWKSVCVCTLGKIIQLYLLTHRYKQDIFLSEMRKLQSDMYM